jgi:hypothetical protein
MRRKKEDGIFSKKNMIGIFIALIMIMSGVGYMVVQNSPEEGTSYKGHRFSGTYGSWMTEAGGRVVKFSYHPAEVETVGLDPQILGYLNSTKMVYLSFAPDDSAIEQIELARNELDSLLPDLFGIYTVPGVTNATGAYSRFPVITCANATLFVPVIQIRSGAAESSIHTAGNCIVLDAQQERDVMMLKDRLLYGMLGIIE